MSAFYQERFVNKAYAFAMQKPTDWIERQDRELISNLKKYELDKKALDDLIRQNKDSLLLPFMINMIPKHTPGSLQPSMCSYAPIQPLVLKRSCPSSFKAGVGSAFPARLIKRAVF